MGGNCVELAFGTARLLLDLGLPLRATGPESVTLPDVPGLATGGVPEFLGVVLSHSHLDHCGLVARIHPGTPLFLGAGAKQVLAAAADFTGHGIAVGRAATYCDRVPFEVGPFRITPYLNDHSAYDAYSLLVEAGSSRLFYTGDLRGHGRTAHRFERLLANGPRGVDAVLLEGTTIGRDEARARTEAMLEDDILGSIRDADGLVLTCFSGQNVDRVV